MPQPIHEPCLDEVSLFAEGLSDEELQEAFNQVGRLDLPADLFLQSSEQLPSVDPIPSNKMPFASDILNRSIIESISSDSLACEPYSPQPAPASLSVIPNLQTNPKEC